MIAIIHACILGIIEGLTEFLPISSTGHLIVAEQLLGFHDSQDIFTVVIQLGAIAAVLWYFRHDLWQRTRGLLQREKQAINFWTLLVIATIPAGIIGLLLDKHMEQITVPAVVAMSLIVGGIVLWIVDRHPVKRQHEEANIDSISRKQALLVGLGQAVAIIPGVSRSGATIVSGLATRMDRVTATAFSFYLSIPVLILASGFKLIKHSEAISDISGGAIAIVVGIVSAFFTAWLAVAWLLRFIAHHNFKSFAYYRIAFGVLILLWLAFR